MFKFIFTNFLSCTFIDQVEKRWMKDKWNSKFEKVIRFEFIEVVKDQNSILEEEKKNFHLIF